MGGGSMWTRETAVNWISEHQNINTVGDFEHIVMDGDGRDIYQAMPSRNINLTSKELGELLVFVYNDYVKVVRNR